MEFNTYAYSNVGGRKNNEDYCLCKDNVWVVCDGLGGHDCGEVASQTAAEAISSYVVHKGVNLSAQFMTDVVTYANRSVIAKQKTDEKLESMRTTLVFAAADGAKLRYANVGDSRFYYFKGGQLSLHSEDHSVSYASVKLGDSSYEDIRTDPDRNKLIKVLGDKEDLSVKIPEQEIIPERGDAFLLCTDGFWEYVYEAEMETDLIKSTNAREWVNFMAKRVLLRTKNTDNDNFTAIAVMIN